MADLMVKMLPTGEHWRMLHLPDIADVALEDATSAMSGSSWQVDGPPIRQ